MSKIHLQLEYTSKMITRTIKPVREMMWFNVETGQMEKFQGSRLIFEGTRPRAITDEIPVKEKISNEPDVKHWVSDVGFHFDVEIIDETSVGLIISFDDRHSSVVEYALDRFGIRYSAA